jgi:hypothetical protein
VLDGIYLEQLGVPVSVISTKPFMDQSQAMASVHGYTNYPLVNVFHPIANASPGALKQEAERVTDEVVQILVTS